MANGGGSCADSSRGAQRTGCNGDRGYPAGLRSCLAAMRPDIMAASIRPHVYTSQAKMVASRTTHSAGSCVFHIDPTA